MRARIQKLLVVFIATLAALGLGRSSPARACTAFSAPTPEGRLLAKSFDWSTGRGWIVLTERGRERSPLVPGSAPSLAGPARHASLSLTTVGPGFPVSGMNEAGLAIEALVDLGATAARTPESGRLVSLEMVQLGLDQFATVAELSDFVRRAGFTQLAVPLHFFACDRGGDCAVIETGWAGVRVTRGLPVAALANRPYADDLDDSRPRTGILAWLGFRRPRATPESSQARFRAVADALRAGPPAGESAALSLLEKAVMRHRTQWQIVWNLDRGTALVRQREAGLGTLTLRFADLDLRCQGPQRVRPLGRAPVTGFAAWSAEDSARVEEAVREQLHRSSPEARRLAAAVGAAARSSTCHPSR
jgi:hypothetical protein